MNQNKLSLRDKRIFTQYLHFSRHELSVYSFENIFIWKGIFEIFWTLIENNLCPFFKDKIGCFLYLPPLGKIVKPQVVLETFKIMDSFNKNKEISRIENVEEKDLSFYRALGYECKRKFNDYLCKRKDLATLRGSQFKHKRAAANYFIKHYAFEYLDFSLKYRDDCLKLYHCWMQERKAKNQDPVYQAMLEDSYNCLKILLRNYRRLNYIGRMVKIDGKLMAFSFGFRLNPDTFCILYEITDLSVKGLAQFIFREFCSQLSGYKYINIMDDSGLENLKRVKLSYRPVRLIPSYIVRRQ